MRFKQRLQELGIALDSEGEVNAAFARFKELADRKSEIFEEDIIALVMDESVTAEHEHYRPIALSQRSETGERPHASVAFTAGDANCTPSDGNGPVDARRRSSPRSRVAPKCCSIRSMRSPRAAQNRRVR